MRILIVGASRNNSIGYHLGQALETDGHAITCASRSGTLGRQCDITDPRAVARLFGTIRPEIVINAAGVMPQREQLGSIKDWRRTKELLQAKTAGALCLTNVAVRYKVKQVIMIGGAAVSNEPTFAAFTIGNGALAAAVAFAARHTPLRIYYLALPPVRNSTMFTHYLCGEKTATKHRMINAATPIEKVIGAIKKIIGGTYQSGARIEITE